MYKVIIVEDDPMVAAINARYLKANDQLRLVGSFANGQDALSYLQNHPVDLAVIDYYMPILNGRDFIFQCRLEHISLDVIMITANNAAQEVAEIMRLGAVDYLVKPFTQERFAQAIQRYLDQKEAFQSGLQLSQTEIDKVLAPGAGTAAEPSLLDKGLQQQTLDKILEYLKSNRQTFFSSEEISREVGLSRITVRRYMNYLLETGVIVSQVDYTTGGRPSIRYRKR